VEGPILFEVVVEYPNEITKEPHIHYFTPEYTKAQTFFYVAKEIIGGTAGVFCHLALDEDGTPLCNPCEAARQRFATRELYRSRPLPKVFAPDV
jgi:hypothetical protein